MQEKSYTDLLALIQSLIGAGELTTDEQAKILNFVNRRAFEAYNTSPSWSRYIVSSEARDLNSYHFNWSYCKYKHISKPKLCFARNKRWKRR